MSGVYSIVCSDVDQRKLQSFATLAFVKGIHWWLVNSLHKGPVMQKRFLFYDVIIMEYHKCDFTWLLTHFPLYKRAACFTDNLFKYICMNEKLRILIGILLKLVPNGPIDDKSALVMGPCAGNSPGTGEFPAQMASNTEMFPLMTSSWLALLEITQSLGPCFTVNSSPPSAAYMHQWIGSPLVQIMACRLFDTKPLSEPMLDYCQLDP